MELFAIMDFIFAGICIVLGILQLFHKGPMLSAGYQNLSEEEKKTADKAPFYKQSGLVLLAVGVILGVMGLSNIFSDNWLQYLSIALVIFLVVFTLMFTKRTNGKKQ